MTSTVALCRATGTEAGYQMSEQIEADRFRRAMGRFPTGVTIVTAFDAAGELCGLTANAFSSVSLDPPLILVCVNRTTRCYRAIRESGRFAVHFLRSDQQDLALGFARKGADRSGLCRWTDSHNGVPRLEHFDTVIDCDLRDAHGAGDHAICVGRVLDIESGGEASEPLLFHEGQLIPWAA